MDIKKIVAGFFVTNNYIVREGESCILIDAEVSLEKVKSEVSKLDAILLTHGHFDHIKHLGELAKYYGCDIYLHENAVEKLPDASKNSSETFRGKVRINPEGLSFRTLRGGERLNFGEIKDIQVFATPGHTSCSISFLIGDALFSGDTLFMNGIGRCDLWDSNPNDMLESLKTLASIDYKYIYPGHGESGEALNQKRKVNFTRINE